MAFFTRAHAKHMASRQHPDAGPPTEWLRNVAPQIKSGQRGGVATAIDRRTPRQRTGLGSKPERSGGFCQVERLDTVRIAEKPQLPFHTIPQHHSIHTAQLVKTCFAPVSHDVNQHFGIAVGFEYTAQTLQLLTQSPIVVNFAVEADEPATSRIAHRLRDHGSSIDNGKALVAEHNASIC